MPLTSISVLADATSADNDGAALVADPLTVAIGGAAPANHFSLRFDFSTVADTDTIVDALMTITTSAAASATGVDVWAAEFGAAIAVDDYNRAGSTVSPVTIRIDEVIPDLTVITTALSINIPSEYLNKLAAINSTFSDFELRPTVGYTPGIGNEAAVHGSSATAGLVPRIDYVAITDTELANGQTGTYRRIAIGAEAFLAFDVETESGEAVKADIILDVEGTGLDSYIENLSSRALSSNRIQPRKITPGRAGAGGDFSFEVTPEKCWKLLLGIFEVATTGPVGSQYTHTFTVGQSNTIKTFTFIQKMGAFRFVYPGSMLSSLTLSARLDDIVMASCAAMCRDEYFYDENSAGGATDAYLLTSTAAYDSTTNSLLSFAGVSVEFDAVADPGLVQDFSITFDQAVAERRGLANTRFVAGHYPGPVSASINFSMQFENERQYKKFIGDNTQDFPTRASTCLELQAMNLKLLGVCGTTDFEADIVIPAMAYNTIRKPVQGADAITLQCSAVAVMSGSDYVSVVVKNTEVSYPDSTDYITVLPAGVDYPTT